MKRPIPLFVTFTILLLCFFGSSSHSLSQELKKKHQNGVIIISNPKNPQPENGIPIRIVFTEELSIGAEYGDENYMFGNRVYFNVDGGGHFYVNDWDKKCIRKFDPNGHFLLTIGRPGQGPGEFQNVWHPRFDKNNNLYISDIVGNRRITRFDKDGTFLELIKVPIRLSDILINSQGFYIGYQTSMNEDSATTVLGLFDPEFQLLSEFHKTTRVFTSPSGRGSDSRAQFLANLLDDEAFTPNMTCILADDDSVYFGYPENYEISIYSPEGKLKKIIRRDYDPIKVGKKHIEGFIQYQEDEFFRFSPYPEDIKKKVFELIEYPKFKAAYDTFALMDNGWIAVVVDYIADEYTLIDLFDKQGTYIAQFEAKIPIQNLLFKNVKAYALAIENDFRYVKRYRYEIQEYRDKKWIKKNLDYD
jgi:hypothetical protein